MKVFSGIDPKRDEDGRLVEDITWETIGEDLYRIHHQTPASERDGARQIFIKGLKRSLELEIQDAHKAMQASYSQGGDMAQLKHRYHRYVAGWHQILELCQQGDDALQAAMADHVIIFEGHRYE